jgi:hypothetical protein
MTALVESVTVPRREAVYVCAWAIGIKRQKHEIKHRRDFVIFSPFKQNLRSVDAIEKPEWL